MPTAPPRLRIILNSPLAYLSRSGDRLPRTRVTAGATANTAAATLTGCSVERERYPAEPRKLRKQYRHGRTFLQAFVVHALQHIFGRSDHGVSHLHDHRSRIDAIVGRYAAHRYG